MCCSINLFESITHHKNERYNWIKQIQTWLFHFFLDFLLGSTTHIKAHLKFLDFLFSFFLSPLQLSLHCIQNWVNFIFIQMHHYFLRLSINLEIAFKWSQRSINWWTFSAYGAFSIYRRLFWIFMCKKPFWNTVHAKSMRAVIVVG